MDENLQRAVWLDLTHRARQGEAVVDLASFRRNAAVFIDNLAVTNMHRAEGREHWISNWIAAADDYQQLADNHLKKGASDQGREASLCALTALEVAKRLADSSRLQDADIAAKMRACISDCGTHHQRPIEQVKIACHNQSELLAYFLRADRIDLRAPSIICISEESETAEELLGRILPAVAPRGMSVLALSGGDLARRPLADLEILLGYCVEFLSGRSDVDAGRIAIYGEGLAAALATNFAASDRRVAVAVCDAGLWHAARTRASIQWMTCPGDFTDEEDMALRRVRSARRVKCPVLLIAGSRGVASVSEAVKLHADCRAAGIDIDVAIARAVRMPFGAVENFVAIDDFVFGWIERRLGPAGQS